MGDAGKAADIRFAVVGVDHPHGALLTVELLGAGATCVGFADTSGAAAAHFSVLFPSLSPVDLDDLYDDPPDLVVIASVPNVRAQLALEALEAGADVLVAKPGATGQGQLTEIEAAAATTGRRWWVAFTEHFSCRSATRAHDLARSGRIGTVRHVLGLGPHRLGADRPEWFRDPFLAGAMIADLASHQIHHATLLLGTDGLAVVAARSTPNPDGTHPELLGELMLEGGTGSAYCRVDWLTPDGSPTWGDVRLMITGDSGTIEVRANADLGGESGADHLIVVDADGTERIDCAGDELTWPTRLLADVRDRTELFTTTDHSLAVSRLALEAADIARDSYRP